MSAMGSERRSPGTLRVPFVRACTLAFDGSGTAATAFTVNINVLGVYLAWDEPVAVGEPLSLRFTTPGNALEVSARGAVAWVNPRQLHPVHSLPPGIGVKFLAFDSECQQRIEKVVRDYVARRPPARA
jgi:Tfp pilus assembly protein PilZ